MDAAASGAARRGPRRRAAGRSGGARGRRAPPLRAQARVGLRRQGGVPRPLGGQRAVRRARAGAPTARRWRGRSCASAPCADPRRAAASWCRRSWRPCPRSTCCAPRRRDCPRRFYVDYSAYASVGLAKQPAWGGVCRGLHVARSSTSWAAAACCRSSPPRSPRSCSWPGRPSERAFRKRIHGGYASYEAPHRRAVGPRRAQERKQARWRGKPRLADGSCAEVNSTLVQESQRAFMSRVYGWMFAGLWITGVMAMFTAQQQVLLTLALPGAARCSWRSWAWCSCCRMAAPRLSGPVAGMMFLALLGAHRASRSRCSSSSTRAGSIGEAFLLTGGVFGAMSLYGTRHQEGPERLGHLPLHGPHRRLIAGVVNIFMHSASCPSSPPAPASSSSRA